MYSEKQQALRRLIYPNQLGPNPDEIPTAEIERFFRILCCERVAPDFETLRRMVNGEIEPDTDQLKKWSRAINVYNGYWNG